MSEGEQPPASIEQPSGRTGSTRARPLPPDERRAALIAATVPLVVEHGTNVTTRQIAEAAGVAEGTIFRVFSDKESLMQAAISAVLDQAPLLDELAGVDVTLPLRERLTRITEILQQRVARVFNLLIALRHHGPPEQATAVRKAARVPSTNELIYEAISRLLEPDCERFRCPVEEVARLLRLLTFSGTHPMISDGQLLTTEQIVSVLLDGVLKH